MPYICGAASSAWPAAVFGCVLAFCLLAMAKPQGNHIRKTPHLVFDESICLFLAAITAGVILHLGGKLASGRHGAPPAIEAHRTTHQLDSSSGNSNGTVDQKDNVFEDQDITNNSLIVAHNTSGNTTSRLDACKNGEAWCAVLTQNSDLRVWLGVTADVYSGLPVLTMAVAESMNATSALDDWHHLAATVPPPDADIAGIQQIDGTWSYRRVFAQIGAAHSCSRRQFAAHSDSSSERGCAIAASHFAWWLTSDHSIYAMQVRISKEARWLALYGGIDGREDSLETLNSTSLLDTMPKGCRVDGLESVKTVHPLVSFEVPSEFVQAVTSERKECDYAGPGLWNAAGSTWLQSGCTQGNRWHGPPTKSVCIIGDSHFERNAAMASNIATTRYNFRASLLRINFAHGSSLSSPARSDVTLLQDLAYCASTLAAQNVIILSVGSHWPQGSAPEFRQLAAELVDYSSRSSHCILVSSALDSCFEEIPHKFSFAQRATRNSWRAAVQNQAVRNAITAAPDDANIHFVDLFSPTEALHFSHCQVGDPVHFGHGAYYDQQFSILYSAAQEYCGTT